MEASVEKKNNNNVVALAITVGFFAFLYTGNAQGGLSGPQGFLFGIAVVMLCYVILVVLAARQQEQKNFSSLQLRIPKEASITQTETENGVTIQVFVSPTAAMSAGKDQ